MAMKTILQINLLILALASGTILHAASTIQFGAASYTVAEDAGTVVLNVQRLGDTDTVVSVGALHIGQIWAELDGAKDPVTEPAPSMDLDTSIAGLDTVVTRWTNAPPGGAVEVWSIQGAHHVPSLSTTFTPKVLDWLMAHPKP
jgi:hypothetical protein